MQAVVFGLEACRLQARCIYVHIVWGLTSASRRFPFGPWIFAPCSKLSVIAVACWENDPPAMLHAHDGERAFDSEIGMCLSQEPTYLRVVELVRNMAAERKRTLLISLHSRVGRCSLLQLLPAPLFKGILDDVARHQCLVECSTASRGPLEKGNNGNGRLISSW
jgi:hypothetical protein